MKYLYCLTGWAVAITISLIFDPDPTKNLFVYSCIVVGLILSSLVTRK